MAHSTDMATADSHGLIQPPDDHSAEVARAQQLAARYRREFVDMDEFRINQELFRSIPADLMLRYGFVPYRRDGKSLVIVVSDATDLPMIDWIADGAPTVTLIGVPSTTSSSSIIGRSVASDTTMTSDLPSRRYGTKP